jgi:CRP-like cAMP-binding protein
VRESDFIRQLRALLGTPVRGMDRRRKADLLERLSGQLRSDDGDAPVEIEWVPFVTGRRPTDEASFPGLGSSDKVALILGRETNRAYLLYHLTRPCSGSHAFEVRLSLSMAGPWGDVEGDALPQWNARVVPPLVFEAGGSLVPVDLKDAGERCLVVALLEDDFREGTFDFGTLFLQQVRAELVLLRDGVPISASELMIDVCDGRAIGAMYPRVIEKVIAPDTERQGSAERAHHPWFPVLLIGSAKTDLYMRALVEDIVEKQRHLTDAGWLLRIGIYLELLTCLGIAEAVRADVGDILTAEERRAFETSPWFAPIREAVSVRRWKEVWDLRRIAASQPMNLLNKKKATVAFLEAHHEDLKHAIRLAGPNDHNAQETWHRVFRDAERAVLRKTRAAFPELEAFPPAAREFVLWHQKGKIGSLSLPGVSSWFGDQDGLFASACNQYRASMNHVAEWAKGEGLMDHTGSECIPPSVSLLMAVMEGKHVRIAQLQRRDGYPDTIELPPEMTPDATARRETVASLFRSVSIFKVLTDEEVEKIAASARPIELGPVERIIVQGRKGTSLFIVAAGNLEVMVRQRDGVDLPVAILQPGSVFGEMSLLTGQRRSATVRSIESALVYEVGQQQLGPILRSRPDAVNELAAVMEPRLRVTAGARSGYEARKEVVSLGEKIRSFLLS